MHTDMVKMLALMNINGGRHHKMFHSINRQVLGKLPHGPAMDNLKDAHSTIDSQYEDMYGETSEPRDITVSFNVHDRCVLHHWTNELTCNWLVIDYEVLQLLTRWWEVGGRGEGAVDGGPQRRVWPQPHWIKWIHGNGFFSACEWIFPDLWRFINVLLLIIIKVPFETVSGCWWL